MALIDNFIDTGLPKNLEAHTATENSSTWSKINTGTATIVTSGIVTAATTATITQYSNSTSPGADKDYEASIRFRGNATGVLLRYSSTKGLIALVDLTSNYIALFSNNSGSFATLVTLPSVNSVLNNSTDYILQLKAVGNTASVYLQKVSDSTWLTSGLTWQSTRVECLSFTDAGISDIIGNAGFNLFSDGTSQVKEFYLGEPNNSIPSAAATALTLTTTNSSVANNSPLTFTVSANGSLSGNVTVTPATSSTGTFSPTTVTLTSSDTTKTFTYTPTVVGTHSISITNSGGLTNPSAVTIESLGITYNPSNSNIIFSPYTWNISGSSFAETINAGAYFRFKFVGNNAYIFHDTSVSNNAYIWVFVDGQQRQILTASGDTSFKISVADLTDTTHDVEVVYVARGNYNNATWGREQSFKFLGLSLTGASPSLLSSTAKPKKAAVFGDSITEGLANGVGTINNGSVSLSLASYAAYIGKALNCEYGQVGWGAQAWNSGAASGGIPTFVNSWNFLSNGVSRNITDADYIFVNMGTNDGIGTFGATVPSASVVQAWITSCRAAAPNAYIFIVVPFGQFMKSVLTTAVTNAADSKCILIDLGSVASIGLTNFSLGASVFSTDGIHPNAFNSGRLASMVLEKISAYTGGSTRNMGGNSNSYSL